MNVCSKCNIEKPADQYYTYYHSTRQKAYTRRVCNACMAIQQKAVKAKIRQDKLKLEQVHTIVTKLSTIVYNEETDPFKDNPLYKFCKECKKYKLINTEYYLTKSTGYPQTLCKECHIQKHRQKVVDFYERKRQEQGGSEKIANQCNVYQDKWQKEQLFWLMELLGWTFNEDTNIWSREGMKDKYNNWVNVIPQPKVAKGRKVRHRARTKVFDVDKMVQLRNDGLTFDNIAAQMGWSKPSVIKYWQKYCSEL